MNIFILCSDAKENAKAYADKHVVKMLLEGVQILCSVSHLKGIKAPYKLTHANHPSVKWVCESGAHWDMLMEIVEELNNEYKYRYDRKNNHKSYDVAKGLIKPKFDRLEATGLYTVVADEVKILGLEDAIEEYRKYYKKKYTEMKMTWRKREVPSFMLETISENSLKNR